MSQPEPQSGQQPGATESSWQPFEHPSGDAPRQTGVPYSSAGHSGEAPYAPPYPQGPAYGTMARPTNTMAVLTLVAGIAGLTVLPLLGSVVAVILGPMARKEIARTGEEGSGMVTAGIVTGWVGIGLGALALLLAVVLILLSFGLAVSFTGAG